MASVMRHNGWFEGRLQTRKLGSAAIERQSRIVKMAIERLGGGRAAMVFLNEIHGDLGGTPLAIATASDAGFRKVAQRLSQYCEAEEPAPGYPRPPGTPLSTST